MIARIVTGRGRNRKSFDLPCSSDRKTRVSDRIAVGNKLKSIFLFPNGRGFNAAKARGVAALAAA